jgi:hypothetical protein
MSFILKLCFRFSLYSFKQQSRQSVPVKFILSFFKCRLIWNKPYFIFRLQLHCTALIIVPTSCWHSKMLLTRISDIFVGSKRNC